MTEFNPYQAPATRVDPIVDAEDQLVWRDGNKLVIPAGGRFPHRCVMCNAPSVGPLWRCKVYWHPAWVYLLLIFWVFPYFLVAYFIRQKAELQLPLCKVHQTRYRLSRWILWGGLLISNGLSLVLIISQTYYPFFMPIYLAWLFGLGLFWKEPQASKIDDSYIWLRRCGKPFLASLPDFKKGV